MSVEDLVYSLYNSEMYEFEIGGVRYTKPGNIPKELLTKNVQSFEFSVSTESAQLYIMTISIVGFRPNILVKRIMDHAFSYEQIDLMLKNGASLSSITDMTMALDSVKLLCQRGNRAPSQIRHLVYNAYSDLLRRNLNIIIGGK